MKTQELNGRNIGKLQYEHNIVFHPIKRIYYNSMETQIKYICKNTNFEYLFYAWEKSKEFNTYHAHILMKNGCLDVLKLYENIGGYRIDDAIRNTIVKTDKKDIKMTKICGTSDFIDIKHEIPGTTILGKIGKIHIEPIIDVKASAMYITKYSSRGFTTGYI
jgi:hypothetical protein